MPSDDTAGRPAAAEKHEPCIYFCPEKGRTCVPYAGYDYETGKPYRVPWERNCYKPDLGCGWAYGLVDGEWTFTDTRRGGKHAR